MTINIENPMVRARRRLLIVSYLAVWLCLSPQLFAQSAQRPGYSLFRDQSGLYSVEYPKEWGVLAGSADVLSIFVHPKLEAAVFIERFRLRVALNPDDISDLFAQLETEVLKERQPKATEVSAKVVDEGRKRFVVIDYLRPGAKERERVRQYSNVAGLAVFRVTCSAAASLFAKYEPSFAIVAGSLKTQLEDPPVRGRR